MKDFLQRCLFFCLVIFFLNLYSINNSQILELSNQKFNNLLLPGFIATVESKNTGKWFELETALYLEKLGYDVLGWNLLLTVCSSGENNIILLRNEIFEVKTTEYDVVTKDYVFECKDNSCQVSNKSSIKVTTDYYKKRMEQFIKERNILSFFKNLYCEYLAEQDNKNNYNNRHLELNLSFSKKKKSIISICGNCTGWSRISFMCSWITSQNRYECVVQWAKIIKLLATKKLIVAFSCEITNVFKENFLEEVIRYFDNLSYDTVGFSCDDLLNSSTKLTIA